MGECPLILTDGAFIVIKRTLINACLLYTSDAADDWLVV